MTNQSRPAAGSCADAASAPSGRHERRDDMSTHEHPFSAARRSPAKRWLPGMKFLRLLVGGFHRWQRNRARSTFEQLDDRQLAEIGIARNDIPWAVKEIFRSSERSVRTPSPYFRPGSPTKSRRRPEVLGSERGSIVVTGIRRHRCTRQRQQSSRSVYSGLSASSSANWAAMALVMRLFGVRSSCVL